MKINLRHYFALAILAVICVFGRSVQAQNSPADSCAITIVMHDSFGDGWNGNAVYVYEEQTLLGSCTLGNGRLGTREFHVANGDSIKLAYHAGQYPDECTIDVLNANGDTIISRLSLNYHNEGDILAAFINNCPSCIRPSHLELTDVTYNSASFSWNGNAGMWIYEYGPRGFEPGNGTAASTTDLNCSIYGLMPHTDYDLYVMASCSSNPSPAVMVQFTTTYQCSPIGSVSISQIGTTSAMIEYTIIEDEADNIANEFAITVNGSDNFNQQFIINGESMRLLGLTPNTAYTVNVAPRCGLIQDTGMTVHFITHGLPCLVPDTTTRFAAITGDGIQLVNRVPIFIDRGNSFAQCLYRASDLIAAGAVGGIIDSLYLTWTPNDTIVKDFTILLGTTEAESVSTAGWLAANNSVVVYTGTHGQYTDNTQGYKLNGNFAWDGSSNLVMSILSATPAGTTSDFSGFTAAATPTSYPATSCYGVDGAPLTLANAWNGTSNGTSAYLPNLRIVTFGCSSQLTCAAPIITIDAIDASAVELSWIPGYQETSWTVEYKQQGASAWTLAESDNPVPYYYFDDLEVNTDYIFRIGANCNDTTFYSEVSARTQCGQLRNFPYTQDFESCGQNMPACYTAMNSDEGETWVEYYGSRLAMMMSFGDPTGFMLPPLNDDIDANNMQISFTGRVGMSDWTYGSSLIIGVCSQAGNLSTFEAVDTLVDIPNTIYTYTVSFANYSGSGKYITFVSKPLGNNMANLVVVDNLVLDLLPNCPDPTGFEVSALHTNSADLVWDASGNVENWILEYADHSFTPGVDSVASITTTSAGATLSNLASNTTYYAFLYADCGGEYGSHASVTFTTPLTEPEALPISCSFENGNDGWMFAGQTNNWTIGDATSHGGSHSLYVSNNGQSHAYTTNTATASYAFKDILAADTGNYYYAYDWLCNGEGSYDYMRIYLAPAGVELTPGVKYNGITATSAPQGWKALDNGHMSYNEDWTYSAGAVHIDQPGQYRLVAVWVNDASDGNQPPAAIDNFTLSNSNCAAPSSFAGTLNAAGDTVTLTWQETSTASYYQIRSVAHGGNPETDAALVGHITGSTWIFTDLPLGEYYDFYIRSECDSDSSNWRGPITLLTGPKYNMAVTGTDTLVTCTTTIFDNGGPNGSYSNYCNSTLYVIPADSSSVLSISGTAHTEGRYDYLTIYDGDADNGILVFSDYGIDDLSQIGPFISEYGGFTIQFHSDGSREYSGFELTTHCIDNSCPTPVNLVASNATHNSVELSWTDRAGANAWIVEYGAKGFTLGQGTQIAASTNPVTISVPARFEGEYYVRAVCNPGSDTGRYNAYPCPFRTAQIAATLPYSYAFDNNAEWSSWEQAHNSTITWTKASNQMELAIDAQASYNGANSVFAYRDFDFGTEDTLVSISFRAKNSPINSAQAEQFSVLLVDPSTPVSASNAAYTTPWGSDAQLSPIATIDTSSEWTNYSIDIPNLSGIKRLVFYWRNDIAISALPYTPAAIDSLIIDFSRCHQPYSVAASDIDQTSADISWQGDSDMGYTVRYRYDGQEHPSYATTQQPRITLTGLLPQTHYTVEVAAICDGGTSDFSAPASFTTLEMPCPAPTNLAATQITHNSATITWSAEEGIESFTLFYGAPGSEIDSRRSVTVQATQADLTALSANTEYAVCVRANCGTSNTAISDDIRFTTLQSNAISAIEDGIELSLYPNPATHVAHLCLNGIDEPVEIILLDINGREVLRQQAHAQEASLNVAHLAAGTYFVRVVGLHTHASSKLLVK
ncbi:MAG: fibronectin type III domain-containing protein [Bacteroidales bacterium]|nr:fibronectin type III domain-containing protein [Bacteroidales bacterium]